MRRRLVVLVLLAALAGLLIWAITSGTLAASTTIYQADAVALSADPKVPDENPPAASKVDDPILAQSLATLYAELTKLSTFLTAYRFNDGHSSSQASVTHSGGRSLNSSDYVSRRLFSAQTDATHDSIGRAVSGLSDSFSESLTTDLLTVSGNGTVSGTLAVTGAMSSGAHLSAPYFTATSDTSTSTFLGALTVGTSTASAAFTLDGSAYLAPTSVPPTTEHRLYNVAGDLYWAGNVIGGATTGQWTTDGTHVWRTSGNVGIGTTTPSTKLAVTGSASVTDGPLSIGATNAPATRLYVIHSQTKLGYGDAAARFVRETTSTSAHQRTLDINMESTGSIVDGFGPTISFNIQGNGDATANIANISAVRSGALKQGAIVFDTANGGSPKERLRIGNDGSVGIGTSTPTAQLHTTGAVRFSNFGAGTLQTDAAGNLSVSSDESLKKDITPFARSLDELLMVEPISFRWRKASGMDTEHTYTGFSAQNVSLAIPEAVGTGPDGKLTLTDRPILAALVNAVKELNVRLTELADTVRNFGRSFTTERLCVEDVCVTRDQFLRMVERSGQAPHPAPQSPSETTNSGADEDVAAEGGSRSSGNNADPAGAMATDEAPTGPTDRPSEVAAQTEVPEQGIALEDNPVAEPSQADKPNAPPPKDSPEGNVIP
jgi:hypothetical protein